MLDTSANPITDHSLSSPLPIAVRELCAFTAKRGDLDLRFTPSPTSQEGIAGHGIVTRRRAAGYQREVSLQADFQGLTLRGRADGLEPSSLRLEEIKTYRGDLERLPNNHRALHWAQLKLYGAMLMQQRGLEQLDLQLTYFNVDTERETSLDARHSAADLLSFADEHAARYAQWHAQEQVHQKDRNQALALVAFPHPEFHSGQRQLAEAVYRSIATEQPLLAQAPTGIGKSIGTLFPALKAMAQGKIDKIFFLTAKTSGRQIALDAMATLQAQESPLLPLRVLELIARDKACEHPDKACHGDSCPLAQGFYDRLPAARAEAVLQRRLDQDSVRTIARTHSVCPYYLGQELARWADVIVGDYNYYFDQSAFLHSLTVVNEWKVAVLVDEAHNLVERGRAMYSATLDLDAVRYARKKAPPKLKRAMSQLTGAWTAVLEAQATPYQVYPEPPSRLVEAMQQLSVKIGEHFTAFPQEPLPEVQRLYFDLLNFLGLAEEFGPHALCDLEIQGASAARSSGLPMKSTNSRVATLSIRNVVPARYLKVRIESATTVVAFSATLQPSQFYRDLLGLPDTTRNLDVPSPFSADQLDVQIVDGISTRYQDRTRSVAPIAARIAKQFQQRPGNYIAFFSSYAYLEQVVAEMIASHPTVPIRAQGRGMKEVDRQHFLDGFTQASAAIGFAVLGGAFAEGIDLPGRRLIGVFVATLGLPQFNRVNEELRQRMGQLFGADVAYDYTYLYPGLQKVVQAAGRVIRSHEDRGMVMLIDDRYRSGEVRGLLPQWWSL